MPEDANSSLFGSTANIGAAGAVETVQSEQIQRLEAEKQQSEAAASTSRRAGFDAEAANARAAGRPMSAFPARPMDTTFSAPADAGSSFDAAAYDKALAEQRLQSDPLPRPPVIPLPPSPSPGIRQAAARFSAYSSYQEASQAKNDILSDARNLYTARGDFGLVGSPLFQSEVSEAWQSAGLAAPMEKLSPYQEARGRVADLTRDLNDTYTAQSRYSDIGGQAYQRDLQAVMHSAGLAPPPNDPGLSGAYQQLSQRRSQIEGSVKDIYALRGDYDQVGGAGYKADVRSALEVEGIVSTEEAKPGGIRGAIANFREDLKSPFGPLQYGYAGNEIIQGATRAYAANNSGQYLTPEQQQAASAGLLPGIGSLVGTVAGSVVPGLGSWAGSLVGGGVGQGLQTIVGAGAEREQSVRQTADTFGTATGASTDALKEFADTLRSTNAATKEVQAAFATMANAGPGIGSGTLAGTAFMSGALGERYNPALSGLTRSFSSDPLMRSLQPQLNATGGNLGAAQLGNVATAEAFSGDWQASNDAATLAEGSLTNPQYAADMNRHNSLMSAGGAARFLTIGALFHPIQNTQDLLAQGRLWFGQDDQNLPGADATKAKIAADRTAAFGVYTSAASAQEAAQSGMSLAGARMDIAQSQGASAAQLRTLAGSLSQSALSSQGALTGAASAADAYIAAHPELDAASRLKIQAQADTNRTTALTDQVAAAKATRSAFEMGLQEDESAYGLNMAGRQSGLTSGLLSGRRYDQLAGDENGIFSAQSARANEIRRAAYNPLNDPATRDQMLARAQGMDTDTAVQRHDFTMNVERQTLARNDQSISEAGLRVDQSRSFGSPSEVYGAQGQEAESLRAKMAELTRQMAAGGLTADETAGKMREITQAGSQLNSVLAQQRDERIANNRGMAEDSVTIATAGLSRQIRLGGSASVDDASVTAAYGGVLAADQDAITRYAPGSRDRRDAEARLASDQARQQDAQDSLNLYSPSAATRIGDLQGQGSLRRAENAFTLEQISPYRSGNPGSSPFTAALGLESALSSDIALQGRDQASADAFRAQRLKEGHWDNDAQASYLSDKDRRDQSVERDNLRKTQVEHDQSFEMLRALPEMIAGGGGMQGNSVNVVGFDALTAAFTPNMREGSWGKPTGKTLSGPIPGNAYDAFQQHAAVAGGQVVPNTAAAIQNLAHSMNTQQLATLLQQMLAELRVQTRNTNPRMTGQSGPPRTGISAAVQNGNQSANTNRPSLSR